MTLAARRRFLESPLARDENERRILAIALDAIQKEFRNLDRIEAASRDETPDFRSGLLFQIVDHVARGLRSGEPTAIVRLGKH